MRTTPHNSDSNFGDHPRLRQACRPIFDESDMAVVISRQRPRTIQLRAHPPTLPDDLQCRDEGLERGRIL